MRQPPHSGKSCDGQAKLSVGTLARLFGMRRGCVLHNQLDLICHPFQRVQNGSVRHEADCCSGSQARKIVSRNLNFCGTTQDLSESSVLTSWVTTDYDGAGKSK